MRKLDFIVARRYKSQPIDLIVAYNFCFNSDQIGSPSAEIYTI